MRTQTTQTTIKVPNLLGKVGAVIAIIVSIGWCLTLIGAIWGIPGIIICRRYLQTGEGKILAGIYGIIFCFLIWGILILLG